MLSSPVAAVPKHYGKEVLHDFPGCGHGDMENTSKAMKRGLSVEEAYAESRVELTQSEKGRMALAHFESCAG